MIRIIENRASSILLPDQTLWAVSVGDPPFVAVHTLDTLDHGRRTAAGYQSLPGRPLVIEYVEES